MHGLILRSVQAFVIDAFGQTVWSRVIDSACLEFETFESMLNYDDEVGTRVLEALPKVLHRPHSEIMEDLGTYLVSHPNRESLRRLLRFGGANFDDFLHSVADLPDRARIAVANLDLPQIDLREHSTGRYSLICRGEIPGTGHLLVGLLRAMADDYGALVVVEYRGGGRGSETLNINLLESTFSKGREFDLAAHRV